MTTCSTTELKNLNLRGTKRVKVPGRILGAEVRNLR